MRKYLLRTALVASVCFCIQAGPAFAQSPAGGGQAGGAPSSQPSSPDMNGPMSRNPVPDATQPMPVKTDDKKFVKEAAMGGLMEVELGKVAQQKASSDAVKQFAQKMVNDHSKANDQLKQVASKEGYPVAETLDSKHQSRLDKISKLSGEDFDKAYVKDQLKDHKEDVRKFQSEAQNGANPNVKQFASQTLPTLEQHLDLVKDLSKSDTAMNTHK